MGMHQPLAANPLAGALCALRGRLEIERDRVYAVALTGWRRAIIEDMPQVSITARAHHLDPPAKRPIFVFCNRVIGYWLPVAWPTGARVELMLRAE